VEILAQSSAAFALTQAYNFQGTHILGASRGHLSDSVISLLQRVSIAQPFASAVLAVFGMSVCHAVRLACAAVSRKLLYGNIGLY